MRPLRATLFFAALIGLAVLLVWWRGRERGAEELLPNVPGETFEPELEEPPFESTVLEAAILAERSPAEIEAVAGGGQGGGAEDDPERAGLRVSLTWADDGAPAVGVSMHLLCWGAPDPRRENPTGISDAAGLLEFEGLFPGAALAYVDRAGSSRVELTAGETTELAIEIPAGIELVGRVLDATGAPVTFASVFLSDFRKPTEGRVVTTCDGGGRYSIRGVGEARCVAAFARDHAPSGCVDVEGRPGERVELDLVLPGDGAGLMGVVRWSDGRPVAGAEVLVGFEQGGWRTGPDGALVPQPPPRRLVVDEEGRFDAEGLDAAGSMPVLVRAPGAAPWSGAAELQAGARARLEVTLTPSAVIRGHTLDAAGAPAAGVFVGVGSIGEFHSVQTRSAADGGFLLDGLAAGSVEVRAQDPERGEVRAALMLSAGIETAWDARLIQGGTLGGTVVDERGAALVGWRVCAERPERHGALLRHTQSDERGEFTLSNCPDKEFELAVYPPDFGRFVSVLRFNEFEPGDTELVLRVPRVPDEEPPSAWIVGRLVGPDGQRVIGALIVSWPAGRIERDIDEDGAFRAGPFEPGAVRLELSAPDLPSTSVEVEGLQADEERAIGLIQLSEAGDLLVRVRIEEGVPVRGATLILTPVIGGVSQSAPLEPGVWRSTTLAPGSWDVRAASVVHAVALATVEVRAGEETRLELTLEPGTVRFVMLEPPAGSELGEVSARVIDEGGATVAENLPVDESELGPFLAVPGLRVGTYRVEASTSTGLSGNAQLVVETLEQTFDPVTLELR